MAGVLVHMLSTAHTSIIAVAVGGPKAATPQSPSKSVGYILLVTRALPPSAYASIIDLHIEQVLDLSWAAPGNRPSTGSLGNQAAWGCELPLDPPLVSAGPKCVCVYKHVCETCSVSQKSCLGALAEESMAG